MIISIESFMNSKIFRPPKRNVKNLDSYNTAYSKVSGINIDSSYVYFVTILPEVSQSATQYIVYAHGNGDDIINIFDFGKYLANHLKVGVVIFDYPGYGCSTGQPTEKGCYDSIDGVMFHLTTLTGIKRENITLMGYSLGTGIIIDYAMRNNWDRPIILCAPYKSIVSVVYDSLLNNTIDKFINITKIDKLKCPVKIYHGTKDAVINVSHSKELFVKLQNKHYEPTYLVGIGHELMGHISLDDIKNIVNDQLVEI